MLLSEAPLTQQADDVRVCAITINYRAANDTKACLSSIENSTSEVKKVVVDNSPNDIALTAVVDEYPDLTLISPRENLGFGQGNNCGLRWTLENTACEFIFIINNDAVVELDCIEKLTNTLDTYPEVGIAAGRILTLDAKPRLWYGGGEIDWKRGGARVTEFMGDPASKSALVPRDVSFASGCALLIRRSVLESVGGFDPVFFMYEEDVDLCVRVRKAGYGIRYVPTAVIWHKCHGSQEEKAGRFVHRWSAENPNFDFHAYHLVRNSVINIRKHMNYRNFLECVIIYPTVLTIRSIKIAKRRGLHSIWPVLSGLLAGLSVSLKDKERCFSAIKMENAELPRQ